MTPMREQHAQAPEIDHFEVRAARLQPLHLQVEAESEQEGEDRVGLVEEQPAEHVAQRQVERAPTAATAAEPPSTSH